MLEDLDLGDPARKLVEHLDLAEAELAKLAHHVVDCSLWDEEEVPHAFRR